MLRISNSFFSGVIEPSLECFIIDDLNRTSWCSQDAFEGIDIAFFAGTEGEKGASQLYGWEAVRRGAVVVDNGDDYRMDPRVPLVR